MTLRIGLVCLLLNVPATCECISGTDLLRQFYVLPHWDRSYRPNFPSHLVTVYWHRADQSSTDPITPGAWQGSHWSANFEVTGMTRPRKNLGASEIRTRDLPLSRRTSLPLGQWGCLRIGGKMMVVSTKNIQNGQHTCFFLKWMGCFFL